ncbi:P-loop containing nucleoside triphosphate hydrolase protein [Pholiota molesta]|nr:P-loop containing nucleoside triphosphate hydrolase protein [Pholiota molesta]
MNDPCAGQNDTFGGNGSTPDSEAIDMGIDFTGTVFAIVRDVGEILGHIPYVKGLSGIILQFIKIRDEIQWNKKRCREIIDKVLRTSKFIYEILAEISARNGKHQLHRLEYHLGICLSTLTAVYEALRKHRARRPIAKLISRGMEELEMLDRRVDELNIKLSLDILIDIKLEQIATVHGTIYHSAPNSSSLGFDHVLPPKPILMVERNGQVAAVLDQLLSEEPTRIAILGSGGFGKTTLARSILHEARVADRYKARYFLSCKNITNGDGLFLALSEMLGLTTAPSKALASARRVLARFPTLLCLDNFETPWEPPSTREDVEGALACIADIPNLSLIITARGTQRPAQVAWSYPLLPPLPALSREGAWAILRNIAPNHTVDADTERLLDAMEGIPLGITVISNLLRDGESSQCLWKQGSKENTWAIETGGGGCESNSNTSVVLSIHGARMQKADIFANLG